MQVVFAVLEAISILITSCLIKHHHTKLSICGVIAEMKQIVQCGAIFKLNLVVLKYI